LGFYGPVAHAAELVGSGALAGSSMQVKSDTEIRYHHVPEKLENFEDRNIHDYVEQVERLNLLISKQGLAVGLQVDQVALFANRYMLDDELYHSVNLYNEEAITSPFPDAYVTMEKFFVQRRFGGAAQTEMTFGDTYASFGRGMALNMVRNTDIDVDTSIRGAKAVVRWGAMDFTAVSGLTNTQQVSQDFANADIDLDTPHMVSGARFSHYGLGPMQVGVHGVIYRFGRSGDEDRPALTRYQNESPLDAVVSGATIELPGVLGVDWFVEGDLFGYGTSEFSGSEEPLLGTAVYASASAYPGKTTVLLEGKRTKDTERINAFATPEGWEVANVPTMEYERVITEDGSAAVNSNDLAGVRMRLDYAAKPGEFVPYVAVGAFRDEDVSGLHFNASPETITHSVGGLQWFKGERVVQVNGGYRVDLRDDAAECMDQLAHIDGELHFPLFGEESLEIAVSAKRFWWGNNLQQQQDFTEMENALGLHHGEKLVVLVYQDWSDNPLVRSEGNIDDSLYGAVEVHYKPKPSMKIRAFYGAYKAGIRCSGGQCRSLPGFEGGRLAVESTF